MNVARELIDVARILTARYKRVQEWNDVKGVAVIDLDGAKLSRRAWKALEPFMAGDRDRQLIVEFRSSGYYDPGGFNDPPEGDDERVVKLMLLDDKIKLPKRVVGILEDEDVIIEKIDDTELDNDKW